MRVRVIRGVDYSGITNEERIRIETPYGYARILPPDSVIRRELEKQGFSYETPISLSDIKGPLNRWIRMRSTYALKKLGRKPRESVETGLVSLGYRVKHTKPSNYVHKEEIFHVLRSAYPRCLVAMAHDDLLELLNITQFRNFDARYGRVYLALQRRGLVERIFNSLYPEFPNLFEIVSGCVPVTPERIEDIKKRLKDYEGRGGDPSLTGLKSDKTLEGRLLSRGTKAIEANLRRRHDKLLSLWGIRGVSRKSKTFERGDLGELFFKTIIVWTGIAYNMEGFYGENFRNHFPSPLRDVLPRTYGGISAFFYDNNGLLIRDEKGLPEYIRPDVGVHSLDTITGVEVKTKRAISEKTLLRDIINRYHLESRESIAFCVNGTIPLSIIGREINIINRLVAVFNMRKKTIPKTTEKILGDHNIRFVGEEETLAVLEELVKIWEHPDYYNMVQKISPLVDITPHLVNFYKKLVYYPHILQSMANTLEARWLRNSLLSLFDLGREILDEHKEQSELELRV